MAVLESLHFNLHSAAVASAQIGMKEADSGDFIKM